MNDYTSSLFSYVLQHFLAEPGGFAAPATALTRAYRWILDPQRPGLGPDDGFVQRFGPLLADPHDPDLLDTWAAFAHHGC